jgi:hypothetical protein
MLIDSQNIWHLYLEGAAEDMMNNILRKNNVPQELHDLFLSKENNKLVFKTDDVPLLYKWIQNENADARTLKDDYNNYQKFFGNKKLTDFQNYIQWTEAVHAKRDEAQYQSRNKDLKDIDITGEDKENVLANDEDVLILKGDDEHKCVKYGKGYSFCISRGGGGNMYGNYRLSKASTFYFVFFKNIPKEDERHIMVLDRTDSGWEWTFGKNQTKVVQGGWDEIVAQFPILAKYKDKFVNKPLTSEEQEYQRKLREFTRYPIKSNFDKFTYQHKADALKFGMDLPIDLFQNLDKYLRNEWISVGPKMTEEIFELLTDSEKSRMLKVKEQQLAQREPQDRYDIEICKNNQELYEKYLEQDEMASTVYDWSINIYNGKMHGDLRIQTKYFLPSKLNQIREIDGTLELKNFIGELDLPNLISVSGDFISDRCNSVNLPKLQYCNILHFNVVKNFNAPEIIKSQEIYLDNVKNVKFPSLKQCKSISMFKAVNVSLPELIECNNSLFFSENSYIKTLYLPKLKILGGISNGIFDTLDFPELEQTKGTIQVNTNNIKCPKLQNSHVLIFRKTAIVDLPELKSGDQLFFGDAIEVNIPKLQQSKFLSVGRSTKKIKISSVARKFLKNVPSDCEIVEVSIEQKLNDSAIYNLMKSFLLKS